MGKDRERAERSRQFSGRVVLLVFVSGWGKMNVKSARNEMGAIAIVV